MERDVGNEVKRLVSHTLVTSLGNVASGVLGFLLLPLYSRHLPPEAFGKVELLMASVTLVGTFFMLGLPSALARRFNYEHADDAQSRRLAASTATAGILGSTGAVALLCTLLAEPIAGLLLDDTSLGWLVVAGAGTLVASALVNVFTTVMRGLYRTVGLAWILLLGAGVQAAVTVYLILGADKTFEAPVLGAAASQVALAALLFRASRDQLPARFSRDEMRSMLAFGLPLVFAGLSFYVLSTADRYLIRYFMDEAAVGLYGMGVRVASILTVAVFTPFRMVWNVALYDLGRRPDAQAVFARFTTQFTAGGILLVAGLAFFAELPLRHLLDERYWEAERLIGMLGASLLLFALSDVVKVGLLIREQTHLLPVRVIIAGACNLLLDIWLIPRMGIHGAALATVMSFAILNVVTVWMTRRTYPIPFERGRLLFLAAASAGLAAAYGLSLDFGDAARFGFRGAALVAFAVTSLATGAIEPRDLVGFAKDLRARVRNRRT